MSNIFIPNMRIHKYNIPTIYLDTCAMIEFSKIHNGTCKDVHIKELQELYNLVTARMSEKSIRCVLGNQLQEMGMTAQREYPRSFLFSCTNTEMFSPILIKNNQARICYKAFLNNSELVEFDVDSAFNVDKYSHSSMVIHAFPMYTQEKTQVLRKNKTSICNILNEMKATKKIEGTFERQLAIELKAEFQLFLNYFFTDSWSSTEECMRHVDEVSKFCNITGIPISNSSLAEEAVQKYAEFLVSPYFAVSPYIWIRANLWAHLMQRPNKIVQGDNLDIQWASAYLPFVDYVVTDDSFCRLLNDSGLADQYCTKVYSFKNLHALLNEL